MAEIVETVIEIMVPGAGSAVKVIAWIKALCEDVKEAKESCVLATGRLELVLVQLQKMRDGGTMPPSDAVPKFVDSLKLLWTDLAPYKDMSLFERLFRHKKLKSTLETVNSDVDELFHMLNLATTDAMMNWRNQWELDVQKQNQLMHEMAENDMLIMRELRGMKAQMDTLLLLKSEIDKIVKRESDQPKPIQDMIKNSFNAITRNSQAEVEAVPRWFIADVNITYDPVFFAKGSFGTVHHGSYNGADVVVKLLEGELEMSLQDDFLREANLWFGFNHPHVVKMFGASHISKRPFIVCEDAKNGNLAQYLRKHNTPLTIWDMLRQAALGLLHLHKNNIIHGDLKLNNVLVGADGIARLADFGLSRVKTSSKAKMTELGKDEGVMGGLRWLAPERFRVRPQFVSDVYAFGACIIEAFSGEPPYAYLDDATVRENIRNGVLPTRPESISDAGWSLVEQMTAMDVNRRITLEAAIKSLEQLTNSARREQPVAGNCEACSRRLAPNARFCQYCGESADGGEAASSSRGSADRPLSSFLEDLSRSEVRKAVAVKVIYRQASTGHSEVTAIPKNFVEPLVEIAKDTDNFTRALFAYGCLRALPDADRPPEADMELIRKQLDGKVQENVPTLVTLLSSDDKAQRDELLAAEMVELAVQVDRSNQNALTPVIPALVEALGNSSPDVRNAVLVALGALTEKHETNVGAVHEQSAAGSLLTALATASAKAQRCAARLLAELTDRYVSAASACGTSQGIRTLVAQLEDAGDDLKDDALAVVSAIAKSNSSMPPLLGSRGVVAVLVALLRGPSLPLKSKAFKALAVLVVDESNGAMFKQAGGIKCLKELLASDSPAVVNSVLLDLSKFVSTAELRRSVAADKELLDMCLSNFALEDPAVSTNAARVLGELVKGNVDVVRAVDRTAKLLEKLARRADEATGTARLNAFRTLLDALPSEDAPLQAAGGAARMAEAA